MLIKFLLTLLIFPAALYSGSAIADAQTSDDGFLANYPPGNTITQRMRDYQSSSSTCGKYCQHYPSGFSDVRLRDWRE